MYGYKSGDISETVHYREIITTSSTTVDY